MAVERLVFAMQRNFAKPVEVKVVREGSVPPPTDSAPGRWRLLAGLLWCEWFARSRLLLFFLGAWLLFIWLLPLYASPGWLLLFGAIYAVIAGPAFGGSDVLQGSEELTFSLPPTRGERYLARLTIGGGTFLLFTALDLLVLGLDLSQILAKFYVNTGLIHPVPVFKAGLLYGLVLSVPFAMFASAFALSAITHSRALVITSWFWGGIVSLVLLQFGFWYESYVWENLNGFFSFPLLLFFGGAVLWFGYRVYQRKEIGSPTTALSIPPRFWFWLALFLAGVALLMILLSSLAKHFPRVFGG